MTHVAGPVHQRNIKLPGLGGLLFDFHNFLFENHNLRKPFYPIFIGHLSEMIGASQKLIRFV